MKVTDLFNSRQPLEGVHEMQFTGYAPGNVQHTARGLLRKSLRKLGEPEAMKGNGFALSRWK
jgi:hypothetical protein